MSAVTVGVVAGAVQPAGKIAGNAGELLKNARGRFMGRGFGPPENA